MSNSEALPRPKIDYPKSLWESATSLSASAQSAAVRKVRELGIDEYQGEITLEETLINLSTVRDVLLDTVEKGRLTQLPLRLQSRLLQESNRVSNALVELGNGKDAIRALENAVEELNATIYQLNLQNQSDLILGFERKMNELKAEEVIVKRSLRRAAKLDKRLDEIDGLLEELKTSDEAAKAAAASIHAITSDIDGLRASIAGLESQSHTSSAAVDELREGIARSAASAKDASREISAIEEEARENIAHIAGYRKDLAQLSEAMEDLRSGTEAAVSGQIGALEDFRKTTEADLANAKEDFEAKLEERLESQAVGNTERVEAMLDAGGARVSKMLKSAEEAEEERATNATEQLEESASSFMDEAARISEISKATLAQHEKDSNDLVARLRKIEEQIDGAILKATGYTLFHSFQKRQEDLARSARWWAYALAACVVASAAAGVTFLLFLKYFPSTGPAIYFKISLSLPFVAALTFCGWQYTRERRLEEEYAFKSNISISLKPYQQLVEELVDKTDLEERRKYTAFIISSINRVFTSPTGLVFDTETLPGDEVKGLLKATVDAAKDIIKAKTGS